MEIVDIRHNPVLGVRSVQNILSGFLRLMSVMILIGLTIQKIKDSCQRMMKIDRVRCGTAHWQGNPRPDKPPLCRQGTRWTVGDQKGGVERVHLTEVAVQDTGGAVARWVRRNNVRCSWIVLDTVGTVWKKSVCSGEKAINTWNPLVGMFWAW